MSPTHPHLKADTLRGTLTGTILVLWWQLQPGEIFKTMALASIGAATSFLVSMLLQWSRKKWRRPKKPSSEKGPHS